MLTEPPVLLTMQPVVWNALGYQFEAGSMLAALVACLIVRIWVCLSTAPIGVRARGLNLSITAISLLFTAGWILLQRPSPFFALLSGSGFGALGSGIIAISLNWVRRLEPLDPASSTSHQADSVHPHVGSGKAAPRAAAPTSKRSGTHVQS